jgi:hypothetical protein
MRKLQFLTNDAFVLMHVANNPNSTLRAISAAVGITERATQPILSAMEQDGVIARERVGRGTYYRVHYKALMDYPLEGPYPTVRDLVRELFDLGRRLDEDDDDNGGPSPV